jgi:hypothetical protein
MERSLSAVNACRVIKSLLVIASVRCWHSPPAGKEPRNGCPGSCQCSYCHRLALFTFQSSSFFSLPSTSLLLFYPQTKLLLPLTDPKLCIHLVRLHSQLPCQRGSPRPTLIYSVCLSALYDVPFMRFCCTLLQVVLHPQSHGNQPCLYPSLRRSGADAVSVLGFSLYSASYRREK